MRDRSGSKGTWAVLAAWCALSFPGCADIDSTASPSDVLQLTASVQSLAADGFSTATITVELDARTSGRYRDVTFSTTLGSFVGGATPTSTSVVVAAGSDARAVATLRSSTQTGTARVTAEIRDGTAVKASATVEIAFESVRASDVIVLELDDSVASADGATVTNVLARISPELLLTQRLVTFSTSLGSFGPAATTDVRAGTDNLARAGLVSPRTPGVALVTATVNNFSARASVEFQAALPDSASLRVGGSLRLTASFTSKVSLTMELYRQVGTVTRGTEVTFTAIDDSTQTPFGFFSGVTQSDAAGIVTAEFTPGNTSERGEATIEGRVAGTRVTAQVKIEIVDPPKTP